MEVTVMMVSVLGQVLIDGGVEAALQIGGIARYRGHEVGVRKQNALQVRTALSDHASWAHFSPHSLRVTDLGRARGPARVHDQRNVVGVGVLHRFAHVVLALLLRHTPLLG